MASTTANYGFTKPDKGAAGWDVDLNKNFDDIDTQIKARADDIANIEIGGRNLLQKDNFKSSFDSIVTSIDNYNGIPTYDVKVNTPDTGNNFGMRMVSNIPIVLNNDYITVSFYYKIINYSNLNNLNFKGYIQTKYSDSSTYNFMLSANYVDFLNQDNWRKWHKLTYTFETSSSLSAIAISAFYVYADYASADSEIQLTFPKIEFGTKATDWTPAPEDVQSQIGDLAVLSTTAKDSLVNALNEVFNEVNNGKTSVYNTIIDKGVTPSSQAFADLVTAIGAITTGGDVTIEGDATPADLLEGKKATVPSGVITGTMPNNGSVTITPGTADQAIPAGYHNGSGKVVGDANLVSDNVKANKSIFGVTGKSSVVDTADATAVAADIASGKTAYVNGAKLVGTSTADPNVGTHYFEKSVIGGLIGNITGVPFLPIMIRWQSDSNIIIDGISKYTDFSGECAVSRTYHWNVDTFYFINYSGSTTGGSYGIIAPHESDGVEYPFKATKQANGTYVVHFDFSDDIHHTIMNFDPSFILIG